MAHTAPTGHGALYTQVHDHIVGTILSVILATALAIAIVVTLVNLGSSDTTSSSVNVPAAANDQRGADDLSGVSTHDAAVDRAVQLRNASRN